MGQGYLWDMNKNPQKKSSIVSVFTWTSVAICGKRRKKQNQQKITKINNRSKDLSKPIEAPWNILD